MKDKVGVSPKGKEILLFIEHYCRQNGYPPTVREIGEAVGLASSCSVHYHLRKLEEKGFIRRTPAKPRAIELNVHRLDSGWSKEAVAIPFLEEFTFRKRGPDVGVAKKFFLFSRSLVEAEECFVFQIDGKEGHAWHILQGDYLVVKKNEMGCVGDLVLVWEEQKIGVRKVGEGGRLFTGEEENAPVSSWNTAAVIGKIVGIWRKL